MLTVPELSFVEWFIVIGVGLIVGLNGGLLTHALLPDARNMRRSLFDRPVGQ